MVTGSLEPGAGVSRGEARVARGGEAQEQGGISPHVGVMRSSKWAMKFEVSLCERCEINVCARMGTIISRESA